MRPLYALVATLGLVFLAAPVSASTATSADCAPDPCGTINAACRKLFDVNCVGMASTESEMAAAGPHCMGLPCDVINAVCYTLTKQWCVG